MLPGFRFLFAAIILSMSVLVFGLGAAALLRAAHEQFASIPSRRAPPEPVFAQQGEPPMPTLALLRFEPAVAEKEPDTAPDNAAAVASAATETPAAPVFDATPAEPEKLAALQSQETSRQSRRSRKSRQRNLRRSPRTHPPNRRPPRRQLPMTR